MRNKIGTNPDELRRRIATLDRAVASIVTTASTATVTGWTDAQPRWVKYPVTRTDFSAAATTVTITLDTLPAGVAWTQVWVEPVTNFVSTPGGSIWRLSADVPATGATAGGSPKSVDVTTPDALAQQAASWYVQCNNSGAATVTATIDSGGGDNANNLSSGSANIYLLMSVPGATTDDLPHS